MSDKETGLFAGDSCSRTDGEKQLCRRINEARLVVWMLLATSVLSLAIYVFVP
ncbi:hypothetical protein [Enterobacter hormaechei]|uniref:hypothetical protein n=1 Tax=Enterobacter hormaechei TaxID=158836 RepID=UPI0032D9CEF0